MSSPLGEDAVATTKPATESESPSLLAVALHAWSLCVLVAVLAVLLPLAPVAAVLLLPFACMAASLCLLCAIAARLLAPPPPDRRRLRDDDHQRRQHRRRGAGRERKQGCVDVDRAEAPGCGAGLDDDDDDDEAEEGHGEAAEQEDGHEFNSIDEDYSIGSSDGEEHRRFSYVDTRSYCYYRSFYDLLAFWRSMERGAWR
ncbi:hypothetical protein ACP4OV_025495 [Aristida adscensionis]